MVDVYDNRIKRILEQGPRSPEEIAQQIGLSTESTAERLFYLTQKGLAHRLPSGAYAFGKRNSINHKSPQDEEHAC